MGAFILIFYSVFCCLVAYAGRNTRIGFFGVLLLSIFLTPLVVAIAIFLFQPFGQKDADKGKTGTP